MKILVYPRDMNPYQELLYSKLRSKIEVKYLENPTQSHTVGLFLLFLQVLCYRIKGFTIFHLHWVYPFSSPLKNLLFNNLLTRAFFTFYFIFFIFFIKILRYRLVWTVHNIIPHEKQFINDIWITKFLSKLSDSKIVHSKITLKEMKKMFIDTHSSYIIPLGSYAGEYPNNLNKKDARKKLDIKKNNFVFCFFGRVEIYKGIIDLLNDFLCLKNKNSVLIIAGKCQDSDLKKRILDYKGYNNIILHLDFIPDDMVQIFLNATDILVYPFRTITTSGSVILALSFGKPIICPRIGNLEELPKDVGFFYGPENKQGLLNCLKKATANKGKLEEMEKNALKYVKSLSWDKIANKTYDVYKKVIRL